MKALLFAAGLGTRLKDFTQNCPKALVPINGKTLLERNILYLKSYGITEFVINVHHFADQVIDFLKTNDYFGCTFEISDERNELLETGGGLKKAKSFLESETFLVMNVDILTDLNISDFIFAHNANKALVTLAVSDRESSRKLLFNTENILCGWENRAAGEIIISRESTNLKLLAFSGLHIIDPKLFDFLNDEGKFSIMKSYLEIAKNHIIKGFDHTGGHLIDVGKPESIVEAEKIFV